MPLTASTVPHRRTTLLSHLKVWRNRRDLWLLVASLAYLLVCTYIVCLANSYSDRINTNGRLEESQRYAAPDALLTASSEFFRNHPEIPQDISDILVRIACVVMLIRCFLFREWSVTILRRVLWVVSTLYLLRALFVSATVLPSPWLACKFNYKDNIFYDALLLLCTIILFFFRQWRPHKTRLTNTISKQSNRDSRAEMCFTLATLSYSQQPRSCSGPTAAASTKPQSRAKPF